MQKSLPSLAIGRRTCAAAMALALALGGAANAAPPAYPTKAVTVVVPWPAGGSADPFGRLFAQELSKKWGQPVVVDNKAGANAVIGTGFVAKAQPDGYTLLTALGNHSMNPAFYKDLPFDTAKAFTPIALLAIAPNVLVLRKDFPANNMAEFLDAVRKNPGKFTYASSGNGGTPHLAGELFALKTGTSLLHVPYKGASPAMTDLIGGTVDMSFATLSSALPYIRSGKVKAIALTYDERVPQLPDVPSMAELGVKGVKVATWYGFMAPAGTPRNIVDKIHDDLVEIAMRPEIKEKVTGMLGTMVISEDSRQFQSRVESEIAEWMSVVQAANVKIN
ncbi:tripartite tricarboxylate transporter substrate binding protein [Diaphorobacter ruginosibacter]|uniref:Bug family tripartite tricarboxylate transporter substrate binding protein n=1 Tax=Diaphorobacter ruginosibacter TaxID=1715720 RepID=UPI00333E4992